MVILDFFTAILSLAIIIMLGKLNLVVLMLVALIILYGIQGAYQPAVQASIPALVSVDYLMPANAVINLVSSIARLIGPVIGGILYVAIGINTILYLSLICFLLAAIMEMFIKIPFEKRETKDSVMIIVFKDMKESLKFIRYEKPMVGKVALILASINLFFSTLIIIGLPVIITQKLGLDAILANRLYGYAEGALAAGGLVGGVLAGTIGRKMQISKADRLLAWCSLTLVPIGAVLLFKVPSMLAYTVIVISCFVMMILSSLVSIQLMVFVQMITPNELIGKVMSLAMCICLSAQPVGQAIYGMLFELIPHSVGILFFISTGICLIISFSSKKIFSENNSTKVLSFPNN
jgi:MFS family permease